MMAVTPAAIANIKTTSSGLMGCPRCTKAFARTLVASGIRSRPSAEGLRLVAPRAGGHAEGVQRRL